MRQILAILLTTWIGVAGAQPADKVSPRDGMPQVLIPAGQFIMGTDDEDAFGRSAEFPPHAVHLDAFWIDRHEVTNAQFAAFLNATAPGDLGRMVRYCDIGNDACRLEYNPDTGTCAPRKGFANHPVTAVSWHGATAYAAHVGRRLPTEAEWERAARGTDQRRYPWGNEWQPRHLVTGENGAREPREVGAATMDRSPCGAWDMGGNVKEWVEDVWQEDFYLSSPLKNPLANGLRRRGVTRGGAWCLTEWDARTTSRQPLVPTACRRYMGFRCAETVPPPLRPAADVSADVLFYADMDTTLDAAAAVGSRRHLKAYGDIEFVAGRRGQAVRLGENRNGRSWVDYDTRDNLNLEQGTIAFWMQPQGWNGTDPGFRFLFMLRDPDLAKFYIYRFQSDRLMVIAGNGVEGQWGTTGMGTETWQDGEWIHVAVTWSDRTFILYVNGEEVGRTTVPVQKYFRGMPTLFSLGQSQGWDGPGAVRAHTALDEFVIFSRALQPGEIQAEMSRETLP